MAGLMASAATGVLGFAIDKLGAMLTEKYQLTRNVKRGIRFLRDELSTMEAMLLRLEDKDDDQMDPLAKVWRSKVRELSYDIEDCIDRFRLNHSHGGSKPNFVREAVQKVKMLFKDGGIAEEIQELRTLVGEQNDRAKRYNLVQCLAPSPQPVLLDPQALALFQEARDLVGIDAPRDEIIRILNCEDKNQDKAVSIYGIAGQGKTTLAMEVYHKIAEIVEDKVGSDGNSYEKKIFDCRAFVSVSQTPDMKKLLRDILSQISNSDLEQWERLETDQQLIRTLRECLVDKRYLILIDDIWSVSAWKHVRSALPVNDNGSRIITTTRKKGVANSCCTGISAQIYEAKPLSDKDSQRLFFNRLFSSDDCPQHLRKVSSGILRKCGGLPLAIISMAGLLANRSQTEEVWVNVLGSIATAVDKDSPIDKMQRILLLSYFDLPHHLKSCLLYLSVFPEDYSIDCQQLILLWVAEGLIPGQNREYMEQLGRSYLNELINRSLVQPTKVGVDGATVVQCRVHDIILEFIVSMAVQENFVTIWDGNDFSRNYSSDKIRRLSIHKDISEWAADEIARKMKNTAHIRSINIFGSNSVLVNKHASEFLNSQVLRVLNIEVVHGECNFGHVKRFGQLKYLSIGCEDFFGCKVPKDIEMLQDLETLDVRWAILKSLPTCIIRLQKLVRLLVHESVQLPDEIGDLQALEELSRIDLCIQSVKFIQGLSDLTNLRVLKLHWPCSTELHDMEGHKKVFISSLSKLFTRLQELHIWGSDCEATRVPTPPSFQKLVLCTYNLNSMGSLVNLTPLSIGVHGIQGLKGSLHSHICGIRQIGWDTRFQIIKAICQGLYFLHSFKELGGTLVRMNLVPNSIWLDDNWVPKLANFGLSRLFGQQQTRMYVNGQNGYMAPEYLYKGEISTMSDIYSLGMIIIEITVQAKNWAVPDTQDKAARKFVDYVYKYWMTDEHVIYNYPSLGSDGLQNVKACIEVGLKCVEVDPRKRPSIVDIVDRLNGKRAPIFDQDTPFQPVRVKHDLSMEE